MQPINSALQSISRNPRGLVFINGNQLNWLQFEVVSRGDYNADTFRVICPLDSQISIFSEAYWAEADVMNIDIYAGFPVNPNVYNKNELTNLLSGKVDKVDIDWINRTVTLQGRDLSALFIDSLISPLFYSNRSKTASVIVTDICNQFNIPAVVTPTNVPFGLIYTQLQTYMPVLTTNWDLLTFLAQQSQYQLFFQNDTLYFQPPNPKAAPYLISYQDKKSLNGFELTASRNLTLTHDVIVNVVSWNMRDKTIYSGQAIYRHLQSSFQTPPSDPLVYTFYSPGLDIAKCQALSQARLQQITIHEITLSFGTVADVTMNKFATIQLKGTNTNLDQIYYPYSITRSMSASGPFNMEIQAKNYSSFSEVASS